MSPIKITQADGSRLNALVEAGYETLVVHSRSGSGTTARNPDYKLAVTAIMEKLDGAGLPFTVYLDSRPVEHLPLDQRRLATSRQLSGPFDSRFAILVSAMNAGSASRGAWRRIRFAVPGASASELSSILSAGANTAVSAIQRLSNTDQRRVTSAHIHEAVRRLAVGEDAPNFADS
ncbi:hypothetical protein GRI62_11575 [Erythrobacter arachoides]|uniref:Uncharacterized protein n=1 Tax=Aurantiacibacter arachoides TaxID=1850444 RepID=A0A845A269_9SPHN|nr:hypothetical protein [Aurantiacibacter arachoides]MXO94235.1 hypothetical protein [Aurantiacibacter arachoides]